MVGIFPTVFFLTANAILIFFWSVLVPVICSLLTFLIPILLWRYLLGHPAASKALAFFLQAISPAGFCFNPNNRYLSWNATILPITQRVDVISIALQWCDSILKNRFLRTFASKRRNLIMVEIVLTVFFLIGKAILIFFSSFLMPFICSFLIPFIGAIFKAALPFVF